MGRARVFGDLLLSQILAFLAWVVYHVLRLGLGLVVHPYRTTREIMRGRWFVPLVFLPTGLLVWILSLGGLPLGELRFLFPSATFLGFSMPRRF